MANTKALVAARIRELRAAAALTQEQLAESMGGPTRAATISRYERGDIAPTFDAIDNLCAALGITPAQFFGGLSSEKRLEGSPELWRVMDLLSGLTPEHLKAIRRMLRAHLDATRT